MNRFVNDISYTLMNTINVLFVCLLLTNQIYLSTTLSNINETDYNRDINRKNDRYNRYFNNKNTDEKSYHILLTHGLSHRPIASHMSITSPAVPTTANTTPSPTAAAVNTITPADLRHIRVNHKLNVSLIVTGGTDDGETGGPADDRPVNGPYNEFTEMQAKPVADNLHNRDDTVLVRRRPSRPPAPTTTPMSSDVCDCRCDPYDRAQQLVNEYVMTDDEETDMDVDDNTELEQLQKPHKYIPMETIELAHQRPQRVTTAAPPPAPTPVPYISNIVKNMGSYLRLPKLSSTAIELGLSLAVTTLLGVLGLSQMSLPFGGFYQEYFRNLDRMAGPYGQVFGRHAGADHPLSLIYQWIRSLD